MKKNIFENSKLKIFVVGLIFSVFSFFLDSYVVSLMILMQNIFLINFFKVITLIGDLEFFIPIAIIISIFFLLRKKRVSGLWVSAFTVGILSFLLKFFIDRSRPYESQNVASLVNTSMSSFPSGHAMIVFAVVPFMIKNFPKQKYYFMIIAALVAFSRIYLNVHYLSDIVAGAFLGYLIGMVFSELEDKYRWR